MSDDHIKSEISVFLAGGLTEVRNRQIEAHAAACEKCRQALNKARVKQARQKREALKKASPDPLPNLFLARQGKETGIDRPASKGPWLVAGILLLVGGGYSILRRYSTGWHAESASPQESVSPSVAVSSSIPVNAAPESAASLQPSASTAAVSAPESPKNSNVLQVQQEWSGADGGITKASLVVVRNQEAWQKLWTEMAEKEPLPKVNFNRHVIVGVFAGERTGGATISLGKISETEDEVLVPYQVKSFDMQVSTAPAISHAYLLSLLPRVEKKIRLTQWEVPQ